MQFAFALSPSQSRRLLDQAVKHRAEIHLEPRGWMSGESLHVMLLGSDGDLLLARNEAESDQALETLVGMNVDGTTVLGQSLYLFESHVVDIDWSEPQALLLIAKPEVLQVTQRRRFQRMRLRAACPVHISAKRRRQDFTGQLLNLSPDGLACRIREDDAQILRAGQRISVALHPKEADRGFEFEAVVSNKTPAGTPGHAILGVQFHLREDDFDAQTARERLCDLLYTRPAELVAQRGEL